jgi:hypothetical protein
MSFNQQRQCKPENILYNTYADKCHNNHISLYHIAYFKKIRVNKERFRYISSLALLGLGKQTHLVHHKIKKSTFSERRL